tara:strand:+ start:4552 stop:4911 length:360 start_codon:yes stop_codon:yes gene_type:complete
LITDDMRTEIVSYIKSTLAKTAEIGMGGNSTSPRATALDVPSGATVTLASEKSDLNVLEIKVTCAGSNIAGKVIRELGIFKNSTSPTTDNDMVARVNFDGIGPFTASETLELFLTIEVN